HVEGGKQSLDLLQAPRVCFTDIPEDKLDGHVARYGKCGLGFSRRTILAWGGLPAWYLPNHSAIDSLQAIGVVLLRGFDNAHFASSILKCLYDLWISGQSNKDHYQFFNSIKINNKLLTIDQVGEMLNSATSVSNLMKSYVKEMSNH